jgi:hypothetical protein
VINFRFHLVSLIAVFLALALGVVMGYGVLGQPTVKGLQNRIDAVEARANRIRLENDQLRDAVDQLNGFVGDSSRFVITDRLDGARVLPIAIRGVDGDDLVATAELARQAGADAPGILWLEDRWALKTDDDVRALAAAIGASPASSKSALREDGLGQLAGRLTSPGPAGGRTDVLDSLSQAGFVELQGVGNQSFDASNLDGRAARALLITGSAASLPDHQAVTPLTRALILNRTPLAVAEIFEARDGGPTRTDVLASITDDETLSRIVSTIDDLESPAGKITAVLTLADLARGVVGHYGIGESAERAMPEWWHA